VVSNTNEVRIETVSAYRDAGYYECTAHNAASVVTVSEDGTSANSARSGIELEIDCKCVIPKKIYKNNIKIIIRT
jgi:hypothetical protein